MMRRRQGFPWTVRRAGDFGSPKKPGRRHRLAYSSGIRMMAAYIIITNTFLCNDGICTVLTTSYNSFNHVARIRWYIKLYICCAALVCLRVCPVSFHQRCCPVCGSRSRGH
ncbi:hypothetical protein ARMSODRAFT_63177 [Armillaria solidipes]|uniref:Uncharacterized protein n=1 Tax=Armillaria solidipes TaxID=1076256 RepID=A0A2H3BYF8_9AGAR|nr:hypothetical protein ARMSODRAFT_63177 [Armillaria solidipes]